MWTWHSFFSLEYPSGVQNSQRPPPLPHHTAPHHTAPHHTTPLHTTPHHTAPHSFALCVCASPPPPPPPPPHTSPHRWTVGWLHRNVRPPGPGCVHVTGGGGVVLWGHRPWAGAPPPAGGPLHGLPLQLLQPHPGLHRRCARLRSCCWLLVVVSPASTLLSTAVQ